MTTSVKGPISWEVERDEDGHRDYSIKSHVIATDSNDGPYIVLNTAGLPAVGSTWSPFNGNDNDPWAFCLPRARATPLITREPGFHWEVTNFYSTRPQRRCQDTAIENPLLEPPRIGGSFVKYTQEAIKDRFGNFLKSSSHEMFRGPQVEKDFNRPTVWVEQNVSLLELDVFSQMVDTVNNATLWGLAKRKIKLSNVQWERRLFGTCGYYYVRRFEFDIDFLTFDRVITDEGTKVLWGKWQLDANVVPNWQQDAAANQNNPLHFIRFKDFHGENARTLLNGAGAPLTTGAAPVTVTVQFYNESNFTTLGIPTVL